MDLYAVDSGNDSSLVVSGAPSNGASGYANLFKGTYTFKLVGAGGSSSAAIVSGSITKEDHFAVVSYLTAAR
jgi:hypothetical protein